MLSRISTLRHVVRSQARMASAAAGGHAMAEIRDGTVLDVKFANGKRLEVPAIWVVDNDMSTVGRNEVSGQKNRTQWALPDEDSIRLKSVTWTSGPGIAERLVWKGAMGRLQPDDEVLCVDLEAEGSHEALFTRSWLERMARGGEKENPEHELVDVKELKRVVDAREPPIRSWSVGDFGPELPWGEWGEITTSEAALATWLGHFRTLGFGIVRGAPTEPGTIETIVSSLGGVIRDTVPYGRIFDVRVEPEVWNFTFNASELKNHCDNTYREPAPTVQVLHCLKAAAKGGESTLVDGFRAADILRQEDPKAFEALSSYECLSSFHKPGECSLVNRHKVIEVDSTNKKVARIHFNALAMEAFDAPLDAIRDMYRGYRRLGHLMEELSLSFRLNPGDFYVVNNTRVLHGRAAFVDAESSSRWFQGVYADLDALNSRHRIAYDRTH